MASHTGWLVVLENSWAALWGGIARLWDRFASGAMAAYAFISSERMGLVVPTLVFMGVSHGFFWSTVMFLDDWTVGWYVERHPTITAHINICLDTIPEATCGRLVEHLTLAQSRLHHHYEITRAFQAYQFGFLSTAFWAGTMLALALFSVVRKGFDDVTAWSKGMMMGLLCAAAFFGGFPALVSIDQNIESNLDAYNAYDGMTNEIRTYMRTGESVTGNHVDGASFLHKIDLMLSDLPAPRIHFDANAVDLGKSRFLELSREMESGFTAPAPASDSAPIPTEGTTESTP